MPRAAAATPRTTAAAGWLHDPRDGSKERYWDGAAWTDQTRHENSFKRRFHFSPYWLLGLFVALIVIWATGIFDTQLVGIGLNARDCFDPVDGEVVCGSEAEELIEAQENPMPQSRPRPPRDATAARGSRPSPAGSRRRPACPAIRPRPAASRRSGSG